MRRLAICALSFSAAVFIALFTLQPYMLPALALVLLAVGLVAAFFKGKAARIVSMAAICAALGFGCFFVHYELRAAPALGFNGEERLVTARAAEYPSLHERYGTVDADIISDELPRLRVRLYGAKSQLEGIKPGDTLGFRARLYSGAKKGQNGNSLFTGGVFLKGSLSSSVAVYHEFDVRLLPQYAQHALIGSVKNIFPLDVQPFIIALICGEREEMYDDSSLTLALSRSGLMHIVAVSGMHVAFLLSCIQIFLGKGRRSSIISIVIIWFFAFMTGASPSALRAAFMQTLVLIAPLAHRENDPLTSLSAALAVILAVNPWCASSASLQLSFAAMAGMTMVTPGLARYMLERTGKAGDSAVGAKLISTLAASVGVMVFTLPLMALHYGALPILSPISNLLCTWAVALCFGLSLFCAVLGMLLPAISSLLAWIVAWLPRYIVFIARLLGGFHYSVIYTENKYILLWMAALYVSLLAMLFIKKRRRAAFRAAAGLMCALLILAINMPKLSLRGLSGTIAAIDVGQGQCIAAISDERAVMVDCGSISPGKNAGDAAAAYLQSRGVKRLDILMLTHLHSDHVNGVERLCELTDIGMIIIPASADDSDNQLETILKCAGRHSIRVLTLENDDEKSCGGIRLRMFAPGDAGDKNERCITAVLSVAHYDLLITSDAPVSAELELINTHELDGIEALMVGHHGSKYSSCEELLETIDGRRAIISVGVNNYGHPSPETLERLEYYGYNVERTDLNGTIEIKVA